MSIKIAIDAGHGRHTSGKRCLKRIDPHETREWVLNDRVASEVVRLLKSYDCEVKRMDDVSGETDVSLSDRCKKSNRWDADFFLSIHHNAGINDGSGGGVEIFAMNGATAATRAKRDAIYEGVIAATGLKGNRGSPRRTANFYVLRKTDAPAVLIECGYMDSTHDTPIILTEKFAEQCAAGIVKGLAKALKLKKRAQSGVDKQFTVRVTVDSLNVRTGAGVDFDAVGAITDKGTYTITAVKNGWGRLKSGAGWINTAAPYCKRV